MGGTSNLFVCGVDLGVHFHAHWFHHHHFVDGFYAILKSPYMAFGTEHGVVRAIHFEQVQGHL